MTGRSCTDEVKVMVPSFRSHAFHCDIKYATNMLSIYILTSLKLLIRAVIYDKNNKKFCDN